MGQSCLKYALIALLVIPAFAAKLHLVADVRSDPLPPDPRRLPVVLWHGMGDSCCSERSVGGLKTHLETYLGVYVHSIGFGKDATADVWQSFFGDVNDQVADACQQLRAIPELANGYNAVGFSQGGQFLRAVVQRCQHTGPRAHNLVTLGAQHQGVINIPFCAAAPTNVSWTYCVWMRSLLSLGAYAPWVRDHVVQAQYYKDPSHLEQYLAVSPFLPDINNERVAKSALYADNLASLAKLVLFRFGADQTVVPGDSAWFSFFDGDRLVPLREQALYLEDWIGLRALDTTGRLVMADLPGAQHMHFSLSWFEKEVVGPYLA